VTTQTLTGENIDYCYYTSYFIDLTKFIFVYIERAVFSSE